MIPNQESKRFSEKNKKESIMKHKSLHANIDLHSSTLCQTNLISGIL